MVALVADFASPVLSGAGEATENGDGGPPARRMSPEQATGERHLDARTDIYSLGAVLYEMLVGLPLTRDGQDLVERILTEPVRLAGALRPTVPTGIDAALQ
jgi:serine/threonine-protein kinase